MSAITMTWPQMNALPADLRETLAKALMHNVRVSALSPFFFAAVIDTVLLGVIIVQVMQWFSVKDHTERRANLWLVIWCLGVNVCLTGYLIGWAYSNFISRYAHYAQFMSMVWASWVYLLDALVRTPVSAFYGERAWRAVNKNIVFLGVVVFLCILSVGLAIALRVIAYSQYATPLYDGVLYTWLAAHLGFDLVNSVTLTVFLVRQRSKAAARTQWVISRVLIMTMETQLPPTIFSLAYLLVFWQLKATTWPAFFAFSGKVSGVCMMAVVNGRYAMQRSLQDSTPSGKHSVPHKRTAPRALQVFSNTHGGGSSSGSGLGSDPNTPHSPYDIIVTPSTPSYPPIHKSPYRHSRDECEDDGKARGGGDKDGDIGDVYSPRSPRFGVNRSQRTARFADVDAYPPASPPAPVKEDGRYVL